VTDIKFRIAESGYVSLRIFDVTGTEKEVLIRENLSPGIYKTLWDASLYPSGVYFYRVETEKFTETKKMVLLK
jgi:hypothetical protein